MANENLVVSPFYLWEKQTFVPLLAVLMKEVTEPSNISQVRHYLAIIYSHQYREFDMVQLVSFSYTNIK